MVIGAPIYNVTIIAAPTGYSINSAIGLNGLGQVAGSATNQLGQSTAFFGTPASIVFLPPLNYSNGVTAVNNAGQVLGISYHIGFPASFVWTPQNGYGALAVPNGFNGYVPSFGAENSQGDIVGAVFRPSDGDSVPVLWTNGVPTTLISGIGIIVGINDSSQILGLSNDGTTSYIGTASSGFAPITIPGIPFTASGIVNNGSVYGYCNPGTLASNACVITNSVATLIPRLPSFPGALSVRNQGQMNNLGQVVGSENNGSPNFSTGVFWSQSTGTVDLSTQVPTGWRIVGASAINDSGQIAATGAFGGLTYQVLLDPIQTPEAQSCVLVGLPLFGLVAYRSRHALRFGRNRTNGST